MDSSIQPNFISETSFLCPFPSCQKELPIYLLFTHFPVCYRNWSLSIGTLPLCTCNTCEGVKTHNGDFLPSKNINSNSPSKRKIEVSLDSEDEDLTDFTIPMCEGKKCFLCNQSKSKSQVKLPIIHLGRFIEIIICKKNHLIDPKTFNTAQEMIDSRLNLIKSTKDKREHLINRGPDNKDDEWVPEMKKCSGYIDIRKNSITRCEENSVAYLWIQEKEQKVFCSGNHLLKYLIEIYGKRGSSSDKRKST